MILDLSRAPAHLAMVGETKGDAAKLATGYREVRSFTEHLCAPLMIEDYGTQPNLEVSPPKWHLAHTTWFFERFILKGYLPSYRPFHSDFDYLFNSYYESASPHLERSHRGLQSRPGVAEVYRYRHSIDQAMGTMLGGMGDRELAGVEPLVTLGIHHEQQHQELLLTDIKQILWSNFLRPSYLPRLPQVRKRRQLRSTVNPRILRFEGGLLTLGALGTGFCFDNERPAHPVFVKPYGISSAPASCGEYLEFIDSGGYRNPSLWLSAGWEVVQRQRWEAPLYWERQGGHWWVFTLNGFKRLNADEPVCHISFFEADAFARWRGMRLPTEAEWEHAAPEAVDENANFSSKECFHPVGAETSNPEFYGNVWEWTASPYTPYPGFQPLPGELGEYNGKFMCNQFVLRGGSCATPAGQMRPTYRNFFPPEARWQFSGVRLAV